MIDTLQNIDWGTVGVTVLGFLATIGGIVGWLKKNIANIQQLRNDNADISEQVKYFKAMLKDNASLKTEISNQKRSQYELTKTFKQLLDKKDTEILSLKNDVKLLVEEVRNGLSEQSNR